MLIIAALFFIAFLVLTFVGISKRRRHKALEATPQFTIRELGGIPLDGDVEVFAVVRQGKELLTAPLSGQTGVWWRVQVTERWEEEVEDDQGQTSYQSHSRIVGERVSDQPFIVEDSFGQIMLDPSGFNFEDCQQSFQSHDDQGLSVMPDKHLQHQGERGHRVESEEWVFPVDVRALMLAHVGQNDQGNRFLHRGQGNNKPFIVAADSPEAYTKSVETSSQRLIIGAFVCLALAALTAVIGII